jgi:alpha-tubulin suppressor-like RCC1 family protein
LTNITAIAASKDHSLALRADGTLVEWGISSPHHSDIPEGLSNVVAIATSTWVSLAITTNRAVAERFSH